MAKLRSALLVCSALFCFASATEGQAVPSAPADTPVAAADAGIPVESELVRQKCGTCHKVGDRNVMTRISYRRASPENWEKTIKRMVALNGARLEPTEARDILKYLSDHNGLAPEEARPVAFDYERRLIDYTYEDKSTTATCAGCHSIGRVLSERRTKEEWQLLVTMHRGLYPLVDNQPMSAGQGFRRSRRGAVEPNADGTPPDPRQPMDITIEHLAKTFPLKTPEWTAWAATMQTPRLSGKWALTGYQLGEGPVYGVVTIAEDPGTPGAFTTDISYRGSRTGTIVSRSGKATVYTGYQWRGRATAGGANAEPWREVMFIERTGGEMWGRWFTGAYDETGVDVKLVRIGSDPLVTGTSAVSLKAGGT
jgi:quinohemoprotein amine dehydrogenase